MVMGKSFLSMYRRMVRSRILGLLVWCETFERDLGNAND